MPADLRPSAPLPPFPLRPGDPRRIGPYRVVGRLGTGGMGTVYAGLDATGRRVAVKAVHPAQAEDPEFRARFRREVRVSARVQGPCLVPLLAADPEAEIPWLATAYVPGRTLAGHLAEHGPLTGATLHAFAAGTAHALTAIHAAGVIHRDLTPRNVILTPGGPRVLDFGIAHATDGTSVTRTGFMTGTPGWISPEHYRTGTSGPEGDLFAWALLVAHAAGCRPPFGTGAPDAVAFRVLSSEPDLDGVPPDLRELLASALAKNPADRPTARAAEDHCTSVLARQTTQVTPARDSSGHDGFPALMRLAWDLPGPPDPAWHRRTRRSTRRVALLTLVAASVIGAVTGAAVAFQGRHSAPPTAAHVTPDPAPSRTTTHPARPNPALVPDPVASPTKAASPRPTPGYTTAPVEEAVDIPTVAPESGPWPGPSGLGAARVPSTDRAEIRVATDAVHRLFGEWNGNSRLVYDPRYINDANTSIGFAPAEAAAYIWAIKPEWDSATREEWAATADAVACEALTEETLSGRAWHYQRYAVAVLDADGRADFLRQGTVGSCSA
ncbi:protein kinase domain-containing protein [Streptomyces sp. BI20]|uniref:serine/threonine-protein kinase n=1 Tax=Streptomyces sp. BI20 TaxID=3403460 RepID=UPI003C768231